MKVVFLDTVHPILSERLTANGFYCHDATSLSIEDAKEAVSDAVGIVIRSRIRMDNEFLSNALELKFIARSGAGMENIDLDYCLTNEIEVFNAPEGNRNAVGEHLLGMLLSFSNKIVAANQEVRSGVWQREANRGFELDGKTIGIIGFGNNGKAFADKLAGFNATILAYDKYKSGYGSNKVSEVEMNQIYEQADIVSFHIPQNAETISFGDELFFESFVKPIVLLNASRGEIVNTSALVEALKNKSVIGACLDVLEYESSSFETVFSGEVNSDLQYLLNSQEVIITPHIAGWTTESYFKLSDILADKILGSQFFTNKRLP